MGIVPMPQDGPLQNRLLRRMDENNTRQRLTQITDPGLFEKLATAVLREEDADCRRLAHSGVNEEGKTIRSPLDGITYTSVDGRRHMLAVHHTICRQKDLRGKWLSAPDSDLYKTLGELKAQREETPELGATLILTTNKDPTVELVHEVERAGNEAGIEIRVWTGSALAHFLDFDPKGQWIRKSFLGVVPTHLSEESLNELSVRSVESALSLEDPELWVDRDVDEKLRNRVEERVLLVLGESGVGKTVACLKCLQRHVRAGGFGLVVGDDILQMSLTVEDAIERTLRNLQPTLADGVGIEALSLTSENEQFLLVIDDINRSAQPAHLVERLAAWNVRATGGRDRRRWRILCPVRPRTITLASSSADKTVNESTVVVASFGQGKESRQLRGGAMGDGPGSRIGRIGSWLRSVADRVAWRQRLNTGPGVGDSLVHRASSQKGRGVRGKLHRHRGRVPERLAGIVTGNAEAATAGAAFYGCS